MEKILTIAIPTWNRALYLDELLLQLIQQIISNRLENKIEILVSNNDSADDTEGIVNKSQSLYSFITYNRNDRNIGAKSNVIRSMELAASKFVMVLGDDDRINSESLLRIVSFLEMNPKTGLVIDQAIFKEKAFHSGTAINLQSLLQNYYWLIGNAGFFIMKTDFVKTYLSKYGYDFFNECWPQTQLAILGLQNSSAKCYVMDWGIHAESIHGEVMIYDSFYLWRTCYYELLLSINDLTGLISPETYHAARTYMKKSLVQQLFNILQCGIFVDEKEIRLKTRRHIFKNFNLFSAYEKIFLTTIIIALWLPVFVAKPVSNLLIILLKGKQGLVKKNQFVKNELKKKLKLPELKAGAIRKLEFEKDN